MYIRVKRRKATYFISCQPRDTILEIKNKLQALTDQSPENVQLKRGDLLLEDARTLEDQGVKSDEIIAMAFRVDGSTFEDFTIVDFENAEDIE